MNKVLKNSWALFTGISFLMISHGFQGSLLGVRAVAEDFSLMSTGFMMSGYFVGYFIGTSTITVLISRVGHIRVFAAFASLASLVILVHSVFVNPLVWFFLRVLTGISMVCIYTVQLKHLALIARTLLTIYILEKPNIHLFSTIQLCLGQIWAQLAGWLMAQRL